MTEWSVPQKIVFFLLVLLCVNYLAHLLMDKASGYVTNYKEGFQGSAPVEIPHTDNSLYTWTTDPQLIYDDFYAGVYDQLSSQGPRTQAKIALITSIWDKGKDKSPPSTWSILDAGCGTGIAVGTLAKMDVGRVVGLDNSPAMIRQAEKVVLPSLDLTEKQEGAIRFRQDTLINPSACAAGEFSHAICFYFTFYYLKNQEEFFRHMNLWLKQGGKLVVEVVNKYKFDPILESAAPFVGFSLQKYSKERIRKSKVTFDKFDYEAEFLLTDPKAEFYETFRFKNNHVRRQKHEFLMPSIEEIVQMGKRVGFNYIGFQDLNPLGFEYGYLLFFEK